MLDFTALQDNFTQSEPIESRRLGERGISPMKTAIQRQKFAFSHVIKWVLTCMASAGRDVPKDYKSSATAAACQNLEITSKFSEFSSPAFEICFEGYYL